MFIREVYYSLALIFFIAAIEVDTSLSGAGVVAILERLAEIRGATSDHNHRQRTGIRWENT